MKKTKMKIPFRNYLLLCIFLSAFNIGFAQKKSGNKNASKASGNDKWGVTEKYDAAGPFCNGLARVKKGIKWGYIDTLGRVIVPIKYNEVENFYGGVARVRMNLGGSKGSRWGLIDSTGREVRKPSFTFIGPFIDGKAQVTSIEDGEFYMNKEGMRVDQNAKRVDKEGTPVE
ncbi:MAG: WG repeat-containing protein [Bacteroidetes bacterium]|nr:WG repeat-containing protein [Bacteroidota bacterium]